MPLPILQGKANILVSTDVAARGLHINRLQYVVNYDFPLNLEQYCHRVGRTGRQGKEGQAYSLLSRSLSMLAADLVKLLEVRKFTHYCAVCLGALFHTLQRRFRS